MTWVFDFHLHPNHLCVSLNLGSLSKLPYGDAPWSGGRSSPLPRPWHVPVFDKSYLIQIYYKALSLQKSVFTFLLAVTQQHNTTTAQNCKCSVLNYLLICLTCGIEVITDLFFHGNLLHLSRSNWVNLISSQGLLVLLPLYHSGIVLRSLTVFTICTLIDLCLYPSCSKFSVTFSFNILLAPQTLSSQVGFQLYTSYFSQALGSDYFLHRAQTLLPITTSVGALKSMILCCWNTNWSLEILIMTAWLYN